jgi:hypothetical protein
MSAPLLAIGYALVVALLLNIWIATKWSVAFKVSLVIIVTLLYVGTYFGLKEIQGWPATEPLPDSFRLLWAKIDEPDKRSNSKGQIYLWIQEVDVAERISGQPRAYKLPYQIDLAEQVEDAINKLGEGATLNGQRTRGLLKQDTDAEAPKSPLTEPADDSDAVGFTDGRILIEFTELPKNTLPAKGI